MPAAAEDAVTPACLDRLAAFAKAQGLNFAPAETRFGPRWVGAGHEIRRVPGLVARLPVAHCAGTLAVDLGANCKVVKSRGEGACRRAFPLTFH